ncbi:MAG TPA: DUF2310 family Zn-ribbon-containing protein [Polyangiaceae bacterium]|jgi:predicted  nucleic acid-binding Zn ribbon protein|nr:DUF2310 family Zn-ribbon-containing protein [Polyangiaceae bacterium]
MKLMSALSYNPLHCMRCNRQIDPRLLGVAPELIEEVAAWRSLYDGIDRLWLDSGPYESWARAQLESWQSAINVRGYAVAQRINDTRRCYYWLFRDESMDSAAQMRCPRCAHEYSEYGGSVIKQLVCERCSIVTAG